MQCRAFVSRVERASRVGCLAGEFDRSEKCPGSAGLCRVAMEFFRVSSEVALEWRWSFWGMCGWS